MADEGKQRTISASGGLGLLQTFGRKLTRTPSHLKRGERDGFNDLKD